MVNKCTSMDVPKSYSYTSDWETCSLDEYNPESYMLLGKALLVSLLDLFQINPFSRLGVSDYHFLHTLRKTIAQKVFTDC